MSRTAVISRLNVSSHAGQKAPFDVRSVALELGSVPIDLAPYNSTSVLTRALSTAAAAWRLLAAASSIRRMDAVITQHPLGKLNDLILVVVARGVSTITLVHDLEMLRWSKHSLRESQRLAHSAVVISPTQAMADFIRTRVPDVRLLDLERFDYVVADAPSLVGASPLPARIIVAGSLDPLKAPYVYRLENLAMPVDLYGPSCRVDFLKSGVHYRGIISTATPALNDRDAFGLVWDGTSVTELAGPTGRYLFYNAPHKFSLYMALGLPVLVSQRSALAPLVRRHGLGLLIEDLASGASAVSEISPGRWSELLHNVDVFRRGLLHGEATRSVLTKALELVGIAPVPPLVKGPTAGDVLTED